MTLWRVFLETEAPCVKVRETADVETFARLATSSRVVLFRAFFSIPDVTPNESCSVGRRKRARRRLMAECIASAG